MHGGRELESAECARFRGAERWGNEFGWETVGGLLLFA